VVVGVGVVDFTATKKLTQKKGRFFIPSLPDFNPTSSHVGFNFL